MGMPVSRMLEEMTALEESYWLALYRESPWGEERADLRSAQVTQMIHATHAKKPKEIGDFLMFRPRVSKSAEVRKNFELLIAKQRKANGG